jgi:hypothetical protein
MRIFKSTVQLLFIALLALAHSSVFAGEVTAFGPRQYVRTTGAPNIYLESFTAEPGEALLVIRNGEPGQKSNNDNRVTSGVISLNGEVLFSHDDFKHQTYTLETPITLLESNSLRIELESKPGTYIYLEIIQTVPDPVFDLMASDLQVDTENCPEYVDINLQLTNSGEDAVPAGAKVAFYNGNPEEGGILIGTAASTTELLPAATENITYKWLNPSVEEASIYARVDDDGTGTGSYEEIDETNNSIAVVAALCRVSAGDSSISGHIIDAVNGNLLAGVQTILYVDDNGTPGVVAASAESDSEGIFFFPDLAAGSYIIAASHTGYIDNQRIITVGENVQLTNQDLVLSPVLSDDEIRIVLTWNDRPADLEAHLTEPNQNGCRYHCYYFNKTTPTASLDLDDRDGYGPETITITDKVTGTYRYYVHDFTNRNINSRCLSLSGAEVKVYSGSREPLVFTVPYAYGNVWHVFDLDGATGEITPVQNMTRQSEPGRIDYPVILSWAPYRAYWGSPYTYQVQATDPDNDTLTYSLTQAPAGMTIDPVTGRIEWTPSGAQSGRYYATVKVEDGRCGEVTQSFSVYVYSQPIVQFSVSPCSGYNPGGNITLSWSTSRVTTVLIDQGIGEVEPVGSLTIPSPEAPTLYTLTAFNDAALVKRTTPTAPGASFYFSPYSISQGQSTTLYWNSGCSVSRSIDHNVGAVPVSGSMTVTPASTTYYYLSANNAGGTRSYRATVYVRQPPPPPRPSVYFSIAPTCNLTPGEPLTLSWSTSNATSVTISPDIGEVELNGSLQQYPSTAGSYTLTATGPGGTTQRTVYFPNYPSLSFYSSSYGIDLGNPVTLYWSASCADKVTLNQGIGEIAPNGSLTVTPDVLPITYTITAVNERGPVSRSVRLYQIAPFGTLTADPTILKVGNSTTLTWTSTRADTCSITPDIGPVDCNGSMTVTPTRPTRYYFNMAGPGGTYSRSVYVSFVPPVADLQAEPLTIREGESTRLTWIFANATSCVIDQGIGEVELGGERTVSPTTTTTYTMTATGPGGTATDRVTITVIPANPPPAINLSVSDSFIVRGEATILSWESSYADSVVIDQGIGAVATSGTATVTPEVTTTYTATATGPGGTSTAKVTVTVIQPSPTISLAADPVSIMAGESAILTWSSSDADTIQFNQGIGSVPLQGSLTVSPIATTTYTLTATGPGGTTSKSVTITVTWPEPTVSFSATPATVQIGESTLLTWSTTDAETVSIEPEIGPVTPNGSISVSPAETTTYTITATGPGGSVSATVSVTVTYPVPAITVSADPSTIQPGDSATLSWTSTDADSVTIEPGIGTQPANGQVTVTPSATTTYTVTATGPGGSVSETVTVTVAEPSPITLTITSPVDGGTLDRTDVMVTGTVSHANGLETGVVVNGIVALVYNGQFAANDVSMHEGENTITVTATDVDGKTAEKSVAFTVQSATKQVEIFASRKSGLAPMETDISLSTNFTIAGSTNLSCSGPGTVEYLASSQGSYTVRMTVPGIYYFTGTAHDDLGDSFTDDIAILALDRTALDALLQAKWNGMKESLLQNQIDNAVQFFLEGSQTIYKNQFEFMAAEGVLSQMVNTMGAFRLVKHESYGMVYDLRTVKDNVEYSFQVLFVQDGNGIWRIKNY